MTFPSMIIPIFLFQESDDAEGVVGSVWVEDYLCLH